MVLRAQSVPRDTSKSLHVSVFLRQSPCVGSFASLSRPKDRFHGRVASQAAGVTFQLPPRRDVGQLTRHDEKGTNLKDLSAQNSAERRACAFQVNLVETLTWAEVRAGNAPMVWYGFGVVLFGRRADDDVGIFSQSFHQDRSS